MWTLQNSDACFRGWDYDLIFYISYIYPTSILYIKQPGGVIFREIRELLSLHFNPESIIHVPRSCNRCAHELAHYGLSRDPDQPMLWFDPLPSFVSVLLDRDCTDLEFSE